MVIIHIVYGVKILGKWYIGVLKFNFFLFFRRKKYVLAVCFSNFQSVVCVKGLRVFQEVKKAVIDNCNYPLKVVYW
jgi:hypothetical protein